MADEDFPKVSYRVTSVVEGKSPAWSSFCFEIAIERTLNGFDGTSLSLELPKDASSQEVESAILRCVNWHLQSRTGLEFPPCRVVNETVRADAPPAPPSSEPVVDSAPVVDGVPAPVEGEAAPAPVS